jgi:hypothetical protein
MSHLYLGHCSRTGVAGDTIFPKLKSMRYRWWRAAQKRPAEKRRANRFPIGFDKFFFRGYRHVALVTESVFRMRSNRHEFTELLAVSTFGMTGQTIGLFTAKG